MITAEDDSSHTFTWTTRQPNKKQQAINQITVWMKNQNGSRRSCALDSTTPTVIFSPTWLESLSEHFPPPPRLLFPFSHTFSFLVPFRMSRKEEGAGGERLRARDIFGRPLDRSTVLAKKPWKTFTLSLASKTSQKLLVEQQQHEQKYINRSRLVIEFEAYHLSFRVRASHWILPLGLLFYSFNVCLFLNFHYNFTLFCTR